MFAVPDSDPPSTPDSRRGSQSQHPSTTPAGAPPTGYTAQSFTPAGPPPASSLFGASYTNPTASRPLFAKPSSGSGMFAVPSSPPRHGDDDGDDDDMDAHEDDDYSEDADGESMFGQSTGAYAAYNQPPRPMNPVPPARNSMGESQYTDYDSPRGMKRSRYGDALVSSFRSSRAAHVDSRQSTVASIAKGLVKQPAPALDEPDDLVLQSERLLAALSASVRATPNADVDLLAVRAAQQLTDVWRKHVTTQSVPGNIGPKRQKSPLDKANYLASLLLRLHHPFTSQHNPKSNANIFGRSSRFMHLALQKDVVTPVPKSLLDWLNTYHNPFPDDLPEVLRHRPSPVAHERYWDMVYATTLRGDLATAISLLDNADFTKADTAVDDGYDEPGYNPRQADAARYVASRAANLLRSCPAYADDNWDVKDAEWAIFRNRVRREISDLEDYAESESRDRDTNLDDPNVFRSSTAGPGRNGLSFSTASRRAESKVPWSVYQNLKVLYGQLQGSKTEITVSTQDWLEASIYMTAWWDGEDDAALPANLAASRHSLRQSQHIRPVDVSPTSAYRRQLTYAFASVTDDPEDTVFAVNTMDPIHVGLACIFEEDVEGAVGIIKGWSVPLAAALVEIAGLGGWLPQAGLGQNLMDGFDEDDLMVLSHGQDQTSGGLRRDDVLASYAESLAGIDEFTSSDAKTQKEGWDLACRVIARMDSLDTAQRKIKQILDRMQLDSTERVDKVLAVCHDIGLQDQVRAIAERYADTLAETSQSYGTALVYYARAHSQLKLKSTVDLLISMCLVQSAAFPPRSALDHQLDQLINNHRTAITRLAKIDEDAASLIATHLSGYATLRKFYEYRDEDIERHQDEDDEMRDSDDESSQSEIKPKRSGLRPFARKQEAAKSLLALLESASDSIRGGLYDAEVETVVPVDTLMALLCEALPLMNQPRPLLNTPQLLLLIRAVEDLETVTPFVYSQAESLFKAAITNFSDSPGHLLPSQDLAKSISGALMAKSTTSLSASGYAMIGSTGSLDTTNGEGGEKVRISRAWDWRKGAVAVGGKNVKGEEVLRVLRTQVAKEVAKAWLQV